MMLPNKTITRLYQNASEALFFYFLLVPVFKIEHFPLPFWSYLSVIALSLFCLFLSTHFVRNYGIYAIMVPTLLLLVIYVFHFPLFSGTVLVGYLTWRHILHDKDPDMRNQMQLFVFTVLVFSVNIFLFYEESIIWIGVIQFMVMIGGYIGSHLFAVKSERTGWTRPLLTMSGVPLFILAGGMLAWLSYQIVRPALSFIWLGVGNVFVFLLSSIIAGLKWVGLDLSVVEDMELPFAGNAQIETDHTSDQVPLEKDVVDMTSTTDAFNWWPVVIIVAVIIAGVAFFLLRKKYRDDVKDQEGTVVASETIRDKAKEPASRNRFLDRFSKKPVNEVRKKVFQFEKLAFKKGFGRNKFETIEEWFHRIGLETSYLDMYQKIRYGDSELSAEEVVAFHKRFEEIKAKFNF